MNRFLAGLCVLALGCAALAGSAGPARPAGAAEGGPAATIGTRSMDEILTAWRDSLQTWRSLSEDSMRARGRSFFASMTAADLLPLCREASPEGESGRLIENLMRAKLTISPLSAHELAGILSDPAVKLPCHKAVLQFLSRTKDAYSPEDGAILGRSLLQVADQAGYDPAIRNQFEMAAAHLSSDDTVFKRMQSYSESESVDLRALAFDMLAESHDPRSADLMLQMLDSYLERRTFPPGRALIGAGRKLGPAAFDRLSRFLALTQDPNLRRVPLEGLAYTEDVRAIPILLEEYGDKETGIRDRTSEIPIRAEKDRYFTLWHVGRVLEPGLIRALAAQDPGLRVQAVEVLARGSRYGPCANAADLLPALQGAAERFSSDRVFADRCREIAARFGDWETRKKEEKRQPLVPPNVKAPNR